MEDRCIRQIFQNVTGEELTEDNISEAKAIRAEDVSGGFLLSIRDEVVGAVLRSFNGDKFSIAFEPEVVTMEGLRLLQRTRPSMTKGKLIPLGGGNVNPRLN